MRKCLYCERLVRARGLCTLHWNRWWNRLPMEARKDYHKPNLGWIASGYHHIYLSDGSEIEEHRWIMEHHLKRKLHTDECVHHKNHIKTDNRIENLEVIDRAEHTRLHLKQMPIQRKCVICGAVFMKPSRFNYMKTRTCSRACTQKLIWQTRHAS